MHRYTVREPGGTEREVAVATVTSAALEVGVGEERVRVEVLRTPGGPVLRTPSGRMFRPGVTRAGPGGESEVTWPGRSFLVARVGTDNGAGSSGGGPGARSRRVRAQMPGRVVQVLVRPGDRVAVGQGLVILEAMKMENEVKARREGVVQAVHVTAGDRVETGADLLEFE